MLQLSTRVNKYLVQHRVGREFWPTFTTTCFYLPLSLQNTWFRVLWPITGLCKPTKQWMCTMYVQEIPQSHTILQPNPQPREEELWRLLYVHSSIVIILMGMRELVALLNLSSWCLVMVEWLFLVVPWGCLWFVIVVLPDHAYLLFFI